MQAENRIIVSRRMICLDYAKGFAIILLLCSHCMSSGNIRAWITSFDMPIFFIISGILHTKKYPNGLAKKEIVPFIKKRFCRLIVPYFIFGTIMILFYQSLSFLSGKGFTIGEKIFKLLTLQGIDSMWFLSCYFLAELLAMIILYKIFDKIRLVFWGLMIGVAILSYIGMPTNCFEREMIKVVIAVIFLYAGVLIGRFNLVQKIPLWVDFLLFTIGSVFAWMNGDVGIGALKLSNGLLFFITAMVMSLAILGAFYSIEVRVGNRCKFLGWFGQNSIVVVCTNNLFIEIIRLADYKLTNNWLLTHGMVGILVMTGLLIILESGTIKLFSGRLKLIFGKSI